MNKYALLAYVYRTIFMDGVIAGEQITPISVQRLMLEDGQNASLDEIRNALDEVAGRGDIRVAWANDTKAVYEV